MGDVRERGSPGKTVPKEWALSRIYPAGGDSRIDARLSAAFSEIGGEGGLIFLALCGFALVPRGHEPQALVLVLKAKDGESPVRALRLALEGY